MKQLATGRSNAVAKRSAGADLTVQEIVGRRQRVQEIFKKLMKEGVHFGTIPGTPKPSLWKPGAEMLCAAFRIAPSFTLLDLSDDDHYEFIVTALGTHQPTSQILGQGMGSCSSNEGKYKWRAAVCDQEYEDTDDDRKRMKWNKGSRDGDAYQTAQIRTEPDDQVNTVLKMANKRAHVAMTINVLAVSDMFTQDAEDLGDGAGDQGGGSHRGGKPDTRTPRSNGGGKPMTEGQVRLVNARLKNKDVAAAALMAEFKLARLEDLPMSQVNDALAWIDGGGKPSQPQTSAGAAAATEATKKASESQVKLLTARMTAGKVDARTLCEHFKIAAIVDMPADKVDAAIDWINANAA